ncbi:hypothetical protein M758_6G178100 [Ceratodon purpureus]|uniref:Uncharacterized protein n=1 Tax=Ceratodon purpureus TaxID=3225 RepID=A0A8T0HG70_CERPU|nr:hypothetical protein KC19_6G185200 [Ceratodon purpureus]KAG0614455.1 hypothetical protein M758_6G178100 [Ceratodon purpureus]
MLENISWKWERSVSLVFDRGLNGLANRNLIRLAQMSHRGLSVHLLLMLKLLWSLSVRRCSSLADQNRDPMICSSTME